ncbi:MAG: HPr family phosphocarrier protein [Acetivibrionales bacterium]
MKSFYITLKTINDIKDFVNIANKYDFDVDLVSERYVVDAKSIMGVISLDFNKPIRVDVHSDDCESFHEDIRPFLA